MNIINVYVPVWHHFQTSAGETAYPMFVLTQGTDGKYAAYAGVADLPEHDKPHYENQRENAAMQIAAHGSKLNLKQVQGFFSGISEENYRA